LNPERPDGNRPAAANLKHEMVGDLLPAYVEHQLATLYQCKCDVPKFRYEATDIFPWKLRKYRSLAMYLYEHGIC
jgi:hypothetical protein